MTPPFCNALLAVIVQQIGREPSRLYLAEERSEVLFDNKFPDVPCLRLALTGYVTIPRENDLNYLAEADAAFVPPPPAKKKPKANKPTFIKANTKASPKAAPKKAATSKREVAA